MSEHGAVVERLSKGEQYLIERVATSQRPVVFLLGSALTAPSAPGEAGVPGVWGIVDSIREELGSLRDQTLEEAVARKDGQAAYQAGFNALLELRGQDVVNQVIRRAVLGAHEELGEELGAKVLAGHPSEHRAACEGLLEDPSGWRMLRPSVAALGEILRLDAKAFPWVLTTNFDPLIEVAVMRAGGVPRRSVLSRDADPDRHGGTGTHVVYVHGYWFGTDTLHTGEQLRKERPQLQNTLKRWIEKSLLVVLGYGGWDDVLKKSLIALAADEGAYPEIAWGFFKEREARIVSQLEEAGGRFQPYDHVDLHRLLPALLERLRADRGLAGSSGTRSGAGGKRPEWLAAPYETRPAADAPGMTLLRAERGVVEISGREAVLTELEAWCEGGGLDVQLVTAPGGFGKTRLLRELCKRRIDRGWTAGLVERERVIAEQPGKLEPDVIARAKSGRPMLLAIDYAETWGRDLEVLLRGLAPYRESRGGIRVVLAARGKAEWWERLPGAVEGLRGVLERFDAVRQLEPLEDVKVAWADAVRGFSAVRGAAARPVMDPRDDVLRAWMKEGVLALHVAALLAVEGEPVPPDASVERLFDALLRREADKHWEPKAQLLVGNRLANIDDVLRTVACVGTLVGPVESVEDARSLLRRTGGFGRLDEPTLDGLAKVFAELYPSMSGRMVALPAVQPDRIGERLVATQLEKKPGLGEVPFAELEASMGARALRVLGRAARWQPRVVEQIEALARRFPKAVVEAWIAVAPEEPWAAGLALRVEQAFGTLGEVSPDEADALVQRLPLGSVALRGVAALLAVQAAGEIPARETRTTATEEQLATYARRLEHEGLRLSEVGKRVEALASAKEAVELYRALAKQRPDAFLPDLAMSLNNLGNFQSEVGKREEALVSAEEAVALYRELAKQRPHAFLSCLAMSVSNLGNRQSELGQPEKALASAEEAVGLYRDLAKQGPDAAFQPHLAMSLNNLSNRQCELGRREEGLESAEEAVALYRELVLQEPDVFLPKLAYGLVNLGIRKRELGKREEGLESANEAVAFYRELSKQRPDVFLPELAIGLSNLSLMYSDLERHEEGLESAKEAVAHSRVLMKRMPDVFLSELAAGLNNLGMLYGKLGRQEEALVAVVETVSLRRELVKQWPDVSLPGLAMSLHNLAAIQSNLGQREEALASAEAAVQHYRELAKQRRDAFLPDLASSLNNLATMQSEAGKREEALESAKDAVVLYHQLFLRVPAAFAQNFVISLRNYLRHLTALGRSPEDDPIARSAVEALQHYQS